MSNASVVQKQLLADILQNRCPACNFIKKRLQATQVFSYEIYEIFKNTFFYRTSLIWWLLLAVNIVNQWKHTLKVYAAEKEMIYLNGTFKVSISWCRVFIWGSGVFQTLLAVPHFDKVAGKSQMQSPRAVL